MKNVVTFAAALLLAAAVAPAGIGPVARGACAAGRCRPGRRRCAARSQDPRHQGRGEALGAGPVGPRRRRDALHRRLGLHRHRRHPQPGHPRRLGSRHEIRRGRAAEIQRDRAPQLRRRRRRPGYAADVGHPARRAPARIHARLAVPAAARAGESEVDQRDRRPAVRRADASRGRVPRRDHALHRPVRPHQQAAGGGAHARRRSHLRRFRLRPRARRLEIRRRRADCAFALVPPRRARDAAPDLQGSDREPDDRDGDVRGPRKIQDRRAGFGEHRRAVSMGAAAHVPRPAARQRRGLLPARRRLQAGRAGAQRAAGGRRLRQQPDRQHEGRHRGVRRPGERRPVALGDRCGEGEVSRQENHPSGADPSSHGSHRRHADLCGGGGDRDRAGADQGLFRAGGEGAACGLRRTRCRNSRGLRRSRK